MQTDHTYEELRAGDIVQFETLSSFEITEDGWGGNRYTNTITLLNDDDRDGYNKWNYSGSVLIDGNPDDGEWLRDLQIMFDACAPDEDGMGIAWIQSSDREVAAEIAIYKLRIVQRVTP